MEKSINTIRNLRSKAQAMGIKQYYKMNKCELLAVTECKDDNAFVELPTLEFKTYSDGQKDAVLFGFKIAYNNMCFDLVVNNMFRQNTLFRAFLSSCQLYMFVCVYTPVGKVGDSIIFDGHCFCLPCVSGLCFEENIEYFPETFTIVKTINSSAKIIHIHEAYDTFVLDNNTIVKKGHPMAPNPFNTNYIVSGTLRFVFLIEPINTDVTVHNIVKVFTCVSDEKIVGVLYTNSKHFSTHWVLLTNNAGGVQYCSRDELVLFDMEQSRITIKDI